MRKVAVGMSGGIDSFVTALLLLQAGYEVTGVHLLMDGEAEVSGLERSCSRLGIPFMAVDGRSRLQSRVIGPFVEDYFQGHTPSPCCLCNSFVKWELLKEAADTAGIGLLATGHYVRIREVDGLRYFCRGKDGRKDQSYFLWGVGGDILDRALTPLGDLTKEEVREIARANGREELLERRESMGICFLRGRDYREFLRSRAGNGFPPGNVVDASGRVVGRHSGICDYTVGQRRGMPVDGSGRQYYVAAVDAGRNEIRAGMKEELWTRDLDIVGWRVRRREDLEVEGLEVMVRGLGLNPEGGVESLEVGDGHLHLRLAGPAWAVAPGQPVAFYRGSRLVGGGILA